MFIAHDNTMQLFIQSHYIYSFLSIDAWIITGGTKSGIMKIVGDAVLKHKNKKMVVLGIALWHVLKCKHEMENENVSFH